ncbi:hypothetical protein BC628DRAFT_1347523 [Trametes gibbosa]|nr:hypothetical protein BC628DRAFT_1347523 [Trametes gibbosa]
MSDVNVDSADTTSIEFDSYGPEPWQLIQTANNGAVFAQTLTRVEGTGGAAFRFHGTQVRVYGTLTPPADAGGVVTSSYSVDGSHNSSFSSNSVSLALITEQDGQVFYDSGTLSDGDHTLLINVTLASVGEPYLLDYIKYAATTPTSTSASASAASTPASASASATTTPDAPSSSHKNIGPIVGGVVGGVLGFALFLGLGLFFFFRYFRHRISLSGRRQGGRDLVEDLMENGERGDGSDAGPAPSAPLMSEVSAPASASPWRAGTPTHYTAPSTVGPDDSASQVAGRIYAAELAQQQRAFAGFQPGGGASSASGSQWGAGPSYGPGPGSRPGSRAGGDRDRKEPRVAEEPEPESMQHEDSGIRFREGDIVPPVVLGEGVDEMPPVYTPAS